MRYKYLFRLIALFSFIILVYHFDNYYLVYNFYKGDIVRILKEMFPFGVFQILVLILLLIGGIKHLKYVPFFSIFFIYGWVQNSMNLINGYIINPPAMKIIPHQWAEAFFYKNVFLLNWFGLLSYILLSLVCIILMVLLIKDEIKKKTNNSV